MNSEDEELEEIIVRKCHPIEEHLLRVANDVDQFKQLLAENKDYRISEKLFTTIVAYLNHKLHSSAYKETFYLLIEVIPKEEIARYVNARDEKKILPIEHVANFQMRHKMSSEFERITKTLLDKGASLAEKGSYNMPVIHCLDYTKVRNYLDGCVTKENGNLRYDFKNILPWNFVNGKDYRDVLEFPIFLNKSNKFKQLMSHELMAMFLVHVCRLKWMSHRGIFYANFGLFLTFYASVCLQVANFYYPMSNTWIVLLVFTCLIGAREVFQFLIAPKIYLRTFENYLEIVIIILAITASSLDDKSAVDQLLVFIFLFATFDLLLQAGKHRLLIRYIQLFKTVLKIFAKLSLFIMIIIIAFAISFNVLFNSQSPFQTVPISIFKTVVMITGEYESSSLDYTHHPIGSHLILLLFIIIISIVLMNVILGLAVSDIQKLERSSRLHGFISNVEFFHQVEMLLFKTKMKVIFRYLGRIHKTLDLPRKIAGANRNLWWALNVLPASSLLMSQIVDDEDMGLIKLNQKVNRMNDEIINLRKDIKDCLHSQLIFMQNKIMDLENKSITTNNINCDDREIIHVKE